ncbi:MAG TPA: hypothetical protein VM529_01140 [Gemmata sp.]|nr:hypothetical protein [Gemmata sp.]
MKAFAWLPIFGGPWGGGTFYPGGEVVPGAVVKTLPHLRGCYVYAADGESIVWVRL